MDWQNIKVIKDTVKNFFDKMTFIVLNVEAKLEKKDKDQKESVDIFVKLQEPQVLIGERGQTLLEIQKIVRMVLNKKLKEVFYVNLDINDYEKKKSEYLKSIAKELACEVMFSKKEKSMPPMSSFERRVIHAELSDNNEIKTESRGEGLYRYIVIMPK